jgi:hypothetical protein
MRLIKMTVAKKIGAKQWKKMGPFISGQKKINRTV